MFRRKLRLDYRNKRLVPVNFACQCQIFVHKVCRTRRVFVTKNPRRRNTANRRKCKSRYSNAFFQPVGICDNAAAENQRDNKSRADFKVNACCKYEYRTAATEYGNDETDNLYLQSRACTCFSYRSSNRYACCVCRHIAVPPFVK